MSLIRKAVIVKHLKSKQRILLLFLLMFLLLQRILKRTLLANLQFRQQKRPVPVVSRETKPYKESGAVPQAQNNRDKESLTTVRKPEGDQQHRHQVEDPSTSKNRDKRSPNLLQATGGYNNENVSPNFGSGPPSNRVAQSNVFAPPVSLFSSQNSQFSNPSPQTGTAQGRARGIQGDFLQSAPPGVSPLHYHSAATEHSAQHQTRSRIQREKQEIPPSTTSASTQSRGFPNDPPLTGRTAAGSHDARGNTNNNSTTSYFKKTIPIDNMCGSGNF